MRVMRGEKVKVILWKEFHWGFEDAGFICVLLLVWSQVSVGQSAIRENRRGDATNNLP